MLSFASSSNRTFMELKWKERADARTPTACSNRTFMELKYLKQRKAEQNRLRVLIVPLWN